MTPTRAIALLACAIALLVAAGAHAAARLGGGAGDTVPLWPHVRVLSDPGGTLTVDEVRRAAGRFEPPAGAYATLGMKREVVWLRVPLEVAAGGEGLWILAFEYTLLRRLDVHLVVNGRAAPPVTLGNSQPFASRPLQSRVLAAPLELPAGASAELLVRVDTLGGKILPMELQRLSAFHGGASGEMLVQGLLGGLALFLVVFSLAQWWHLRENLYLKYALLTTCSAMFSVHFFGLGEMYLWTDREWAQTHLAGITSLLAAAATALFVEDALASDLNRWLRRGLFATFWLHVGAAVAHGLDLLTIQAVGVLMNTTGLAPALMGLPGALAMARRGDHVGHWFIAAWIGYFVASAVLVGVVRGSIGADTLTMHSFQIGATLDMLIFMRIAVLRSAWRHHEARRAAAERDALFSLAHSDPLTGLLNRRGLAEALAEALGRGAEGSLTAVFVIDLDGFKPVNDQHGHDAGDALLRVVAQRLRGSVKARDAVARVGGDEFVVMAEGLATEAQAMELGRKLLDSFRVPFQVGTRTFPLGATVGCAISPLDAADAPGLLKAADAAMYRGKQRGKDRLERARAEPALA